MYVPAVIEHASRRIRILGATAHPTTSWVVQAGTVSDAARPTRAHAPEGHIARRALPAAVAAVVAAATLSDRFERRPVDVRTTAGRRRPTDSRSPRAAAPGGVRASYIDPHARLGEATGGAGWGPRW